MLGIGRALMSSPDLLLADEVSLGIAPNLVVTMLDALRQINRTRGTSILLVEQNAAAALRVADYVYVLENGRAVVQGTPAELLGRSDVIEAYLGFGATDRDDDRRAGRLAPVVTWG
jgi:branched-chain amino acid transport system ATP-binding protein